MHVLVVEDEPLVARLAGRLLESLGHSSVWVLSAEQALRRLDEESFDLVLSDQGLPYQSGTQLLALIRQRWPNLPFVLVTGWGADAGLAGAAVVLPKPYNRVALERALAAARSTN